MSRSGLITCGALLIVGSIVCWFFPLFHVRPLAGESSGENLQPANKTDATSEPLANPTVTKQPIASELHELQAYTTATEITQLWNAFDVDATAAKRQFGRQAGLGGPSYFCIRGQGTVERVEKDNVVLSVAGSSRRVLLDLGAVVDNTVRDAIGVKASDFANSQDFNAVSSELNRRVEQEVIAPNRALLVEGVAVNFVGCAKIGGKSDLDPLRLIPIQLNERELSFQTANQLQEGSGKLDANTTSEPP